MATEVLRPQDVLVNRYRVHAASYHRRRNSPTSGGYTRMAVDRRPSPPTKHDKRRSIATAAEAKKSDRTLKGETNGTEQVALLRRDESLPRDPTPGSDSEEIMPKKIRLAAAPPAVDIYAGAGFEASPSPRCLPLPTFFFNKKGDEHEPFEDGATRSLRRMLRLE